MATNTASKTKSSPAKSRPRLRVRMYRQGLGDCFLLTFNKKVHVLIDCGVIIGTKDPAPMMKRVLQDIRTVTKGNVDVLVVTHEHWDHVSGFKQVRPEFDALKFKEVWMAWTEDPENELATKLRRERQMKLKATLAAHQYLTRGKGRTLGPLAQGLGAMLGFSGIALGEDAGAGGDTGEAMMYARSRGEAIGSDLKLLHPGNPSFLLPGTDTVRVYVLGPPENEKLLKKSDPSKAHSEVYLSPAVAFLAAADPSTAGSEDSEAIEAAMPFSPKYRIATRKGKPSSDATATLRKLFESSYLAPRESYRTIEDDWLASAGTLALKLDSDTNNTSLVLAFEFSDTPQREVFLFPGDAQVGNWLSWDQYEWTVKENDNQTRTVNASDLLARTVFYKVGHHGSHNATLKAGGLERMTSQDLVAMVPVNQAMAKKKKWKMPWPDLRKRLEEKCSCVIVQDEGEPPTKPRRGKVKVHRPATAQETSLYIDYEL